MWIEEAPGKWTVERKLPEVNPFSAAMEGPSLRDLVGGDLNLSMDGNVTFGPENVSPREDPPAYSRKSQTSVKPFGSPKFLSM